MLFHPTFEAAPLPALESLRADYLRSLPFAQDALTEARVRSCPVGSRIVLKGRVCGHAVVDSTQTMLEFHLDREALPFAHELFGLCIEGLGVQRALVKSFDAMPLACVLEHSTAVRVLGALARDYVPRELPLIPRIWFSRRVATAGDLTALRAVRQRAFTSEERLVSAVAAGHVRIFERDEAVVGFGLLTPITPHRSEVEVGIAVDEPFRNRGYAVYMLKALCDEVVGTGAQPVSGLARSNLPSVRNGLRIGLFARYRLLEVDLTPVPQYVGAARRTTPS